MGNQRQGMEQSLALSQVTVPQSEGHTSSPIPVWPLEEDILLSSSFSVSLNILDRYNLPLRSSRMPCSHWEFLSQQARWPPCILALRR